MYYAEHVPIHHTVFKAELKQTLCTKSFMHTGLTQEWLHKTAVWWACEIVCHQVIRVWPASDICAAFEWYFVLNTSGYYMGFNFTSICQLSTQEYEWYPISTTFVTCGLIYGMTDLCFS